MPASDQPWYVNGVAHVTTDLEPGPLLDRLHRIERDFGDGEGRIDDPDVIDVFFLDLDFFDDEFFRAEGDVGFCCFFDRTFLYADVF